jgi:AcrR family transcriptional regulator
MARKRIRSASPSLSAGDQGTRAHLLETAGQIFAEKGFDRATGKEICKRARLNPASVNYHFGGMEGLYEAVVWEAHNRLVTFDSLAAAVAAKADAKAKLEAAIGLFVRSLTGPVSSSWALRVFGRELVAPSPALEKIRENEILPKRRILTAIVSELMHLPQDDPAVARACISVIAPCITLLILDRGMLHRAFPNIYADARDAQALIDHLVHFALAGIQDISRRRKAQSAGGT